MVPGELPVSNVDDTWDLDDLLSLTPLPPSSPLIRAPSPLPPSSPDANNLFSATDIHTPTNEDPIPDDGNSLSQYSSSPSHTGWTDAPLTSTVFTEPLRVTRPGKTKAQVGCELAQQERKRTLAARRALRDATQNAQLQAEVEATHEIIVGTQNENDRDTAERRETCFRDVLARLHADNYSWGDFVEWISSPESHHRTARTNGLFRKEGQVRRILDLWALKNTHTGKRQVLAWATDYLGGVVGREARDVTRAGILQSRQMSFTSAFIESFSLSELHERIRNMCPTMTSLLRSFATTTRQLTKVEKRPATVRGEQRQQKRKEKSDARIGSALAELLGERSQNNSLIKHIFGLYLYVTGVQRQAISVLSSLGMSSSYPTIAGSISTRVTLPPSVPRDKGIVSNPTEEDSDDEDPDFVPDSDDESATRSDDESEPCTTEDPSWDRGQNIDEELTEESQQLRGRGNRQQQDSFEAAISSRTVIGLA